MNPLPPETPEAFKLAVYRVALIQGDRNAQIWELSTQDRSLSSIGEQFGISRERARQIAWKAAILLNRWPQPEVFHEPMPLRLRELCLSCAIMDRDGLLRRVVLATKPPRHWSLDDVILAQLFLGVVPQPDRVAEALQRVGAASADLLEDLAVLSKANIAAADVAQRALQAIVAHEKAPSFTLRQLAGDLKGAPVQ